MPKLSPYFGLGMFLSLVVKFYAFKGTLLTSSESGDSLPRREFGGESEIVIRAQTRLESSVAI